MRLKNRLIIFGICIGAILMALAACGGDTNRLQTQDAEVTITVQEIVNRVEVFDLHPVTMKPAYIDLQLGRSLMTGNLVKTHENSSARVDISIQNFTRVSRTGPKTIWQLGRFALNGEAVIELREGKIFVFDEDDGQEHWPLHIETPAGTASARGTWMAVEFNSETGIAQVECFRGICELENDLGYQVFTNEQIVVATAVTVPADPAPMDEQQIEAFKALPEVLTEEIPIPVKFTPVEAQVKLEDARTAAVERKALREERKINSAQASENGGGPGNNIPLAAGKSADNRSDGSQPQASANRNSGQSGGDTQDRSRRDEAPGPRDGDEAPLGSATLNSGESGGDVQGRSRRNEAPGPKEGDAALKASANSNSGRSGGDRQDKARNDESGNSKSVKVSNKPDDEAGSAEPIEVLSLAGLFLKLGFTKGEAFTFVNQGQAVRIVTSLAKMLRKPGKERKGGVVVQYLQEDPFEPVSIVSLAIDIESFKTFNASRAHPAKAKEPETSAVVVEPGTSTVVDDADTSTVFQWPEEAPYTPPDEPENTGPDGSANTLPVAVYDTASTAYEVGITITVLKNDSDSDGDSLTVAKLKLPKYGTVTLNSDNTVLYTPNAGFSGVDSFTYQANDGTGLSNIVTVTVTVSPQPNVVPVAVNDTASTTETKKVSLYPLLNDSDADGDPLTVTNLTQPSNGTASVKTDNAVDYIPNAGFTGEDTVTYTANDGKGDSNIATITFTVTSNTLPVAVADTASTSKDVAVTIDVLQNDSDADGNPLTVTITKLPKDGTATVNGDNTVLYTPNAGFAGNDTFNYKANDGIGDSNVVTVTVTVNGLPAAVDDTATTPVDVAITVDVLQNDTDANGDTLTVTNLTQPSNGTASVNGDNTVLYTPGSGFAGEVTFTYTANDGSGDSNVATVTVKVNALPVAVDDAVTKSGGGPSLNIDVLANDTDANSDPLTVTNLTQPVNGTVTVNGNNTVKYTPDSEFTGVDTFTYTANDGTGDSNVATVTVTVE